MLHIVVTGGAGFIGRAVVRRLLDLGHRVAVADQVPGDLPDVCYRTGDLRHPAAIESAIPRGTEVVIHLAAATSVLGSVACPVEVYHQNVAATAGLLERARIVGVRQFVFSSTNAVVGDVGTRTIREATPLQPLTPYGATKASAEMLIAGYAHAYGIAGTVLRLSNVYGPGMQAKDTLIARLMRAALTERPVGIYGNGQQERDYVYIDDATSAFTLALDQPWDGPLVVGSGTSVSVNRVHETATEIWGVPIPVQRLEPRAGEMPAVRVDISRARARGYSPAVSLAAGLKAVWDDYLKTHEVVPRPGKVRAISGDRH
jgi:UDP-glucose 4-epimerase